jgi:putative endonuclease
LRQGAGMSKQPAVYILSNKRNGTLYVGVTSNLVQRVWQHKNNLVPGFTQKYNLHKLVYLEVCESMETAIQLEKQLKKWNRKWKLELIEKNNPEWNDLYSEIV